MEIAGYPHYENDLLIQSKSFVIAIENKIFHHLHNDLGDYYYTANSLRNSSQKLYCIVLSLHKLTAEDDVNKLTDHDFVNVTYNQLFSNINKQLTKYMNGGNMHYISHLNDFIRSIENLQPKTMENKALWNFFKHNGTTIEQLTKEFSEYKKMLFDKTGLLQGIVPKSEYAPSSYSQWIWDGVIEAEDARALVHDYEIAGYAIAVDTTITTNGWEITLFGREKSDQDFLTKSIIGNGQLLTGLFINYAASERLVYKRFETDVDLTEVRDSLIILLGYIENFINRPISSAMSDKNRSQ